ncbi:MAG TPA: hypothetical protein VFQ45_00650 [Longimicrobium sp.]|nr:hypothetical protein [Longimicrobium sp.]
MKRAAPALAALLLAACSSTRPTREDYFEVMRQMVRFVEDDARRNAPGRVADGPLQVDLRSFRGGGFAVTRESFTDDDIAAALGRPIVRAEMEDVMLCDTVSSVGGCWVRQFGVFVHLNVARTTTDQVTALVRTTTTDRRTHPSDWCDRVWWLRYRKQGGAWSLAERDLRESCTGGT